MATTLKEAFAEKYPKCLVILSMYEQANGCDATWENLTKIRLQRFVNFMSERLAPNSVRQYAAKLKAVLSLYSEEVGLPRDYKSVLSPKQEKSVSIWLTDAELSRLERYQPADGNELLVKSQFLIGAYSGARHSDYIRFDDTNVVNGMLVYVSQKTKIQASVPLKPIVSRLLSEIPSRELSDPAFNEIIRRICRNCGISERVKVFKAGKEYVGEKWEFVTSHTARRSFATNLYLRGCDLYSISRMLGHSSVEMTASNYICCGMREQPAKVMEYFR